MRIFLLTFFILWGGISAAYAFDEQPVFTEESYTLETMIEAIPDFAKTPEGGVNWKLYTETKEIPYSIEKDGQTWEGVRPEFADSVKALDGQLVKMSGYMFPLEESEEQSNFLYGPFPLTCPYHYHAPLTLTMEVHAAEPIAFSYEPVTIEGRLELVPEDLDYNMFYRLRDARIVE
jgi:hypothetical protein